METTVGNNHPTNDRILEDRMLLEPMWLVTMRSVGNTKSVGHFQVVKEQQPEFSQPDSSLVVPVFQKGDDPIDAINHMMSFLTAIVTSR
ncbi:hypothetical protein Tco_1199267, partial [Tanacetum coccineum]